MSRPHPQPPAVTLAESEFVLELPDGGRVRGLAWEPERPRARIGVLHGLGDHAARYEHVARELAARRFAVEAIDLPGHGASTGRRGHVRGWEDYRASVRAWTARMDARDPGETRFLLGHSMGALVALDWSLRTSSRLRGLVLSAPPFELVLRPTALKVRAAQIAARFWPGFTQGSTILPSMLSRDPEVVRAHAADPLVHYKISARLFFEFQSVRAALSRSAPNLAVDALILHGGADPIADPVGSERWALRAPAGRAALRLYPGLLHEVLNEVERAQVIADLVGWLEEALSSGPSAAPD